MNRIRFIVCLVVFSLFPMLANDAVAQRSRPKVGQVVDETVEKEMKRQNIVGVSVGLIIKSKIVHTKGYGFANIEAGTPFSEDTIINWASNSKPVVAVLAMQLVQSGKLDLDKAIVNYLPDLPEHLHPLTTRKLLCHQSGIPHYSNGKIIRGESFVKGADESNPAVALQRFVKSPLIFEPGEKYSYSSYAYVLLSAVVQAAGDEAIAQQLSSRIAEPLKLSSFQLDVPFNNQENWSMAYRVNKQGRTSLVPDEANAWKHGAGGYKSNVKDFAAFVQALMRGKLINAKTNKLMTTPQPTNDGELTTMGLGVFVSGSERSLKVSHGGSQNETRTRMVIYPKRKNGIVVMCNCEHADPGKFTTAIYGALKKYKIKH
jgi:CubicO group peptidase (beta-lactamase class C family)